ncbi:MAG: LacI family DNA-binding transcriptional regulator [Bacteroidota bacterium]
MGRNVTIKDLARKLNISVTTVSRALRNAPDINPKTKAAVIKLAEELDYEPNALAKSLVQRKTNIIGVIVPQLDMHFFSSVISGIQNEARRLGYNVLIAQSNEDYDMEVENVRSMMSSRLDGLIVSVSRKTKDFSHFDKILRRKTPLVMFDRVGKNIESSKIVFDDVNGAYEATEHLIDQGYKRIAYIGGPRHVEVSRLREKGYTEALEDNDIEVNPEYIVYGHFNGSRAVDNVKKLMSLSSPPDAFFSVNDPVAIEVIKTIKEMGYKIPFHIGVIGFNNEPTTDIVSPRLSSVNIPTVSMGQHAAQVLIEQIENDNMRIITETLPSELIVRESSNRKAFLRDNKK